MKELVFEVAEIRGTCPVYKKGDKMVIDGSEIVLEETNALCIQTFQKSLIKNFAWTPGEPYTEGGPVLFRRKQE